METKKKTAISGLFDYLEDDEHRKAKSVTMHAGAEIKLLQQTELNPSAKEVIEKLRGLLDNIERNQLNVINGKWRTIKAAFVGQLEKPLQDIIRRQSSTGLDAKRASNNGISEREFNEVIQRHRNDCNYETTSQAPSRHKEHANDNRQSGLPAGDARQSHDQSRHVENWESQTERRITYHGSKRASEALRHGNPEIADLSNVNRPTKIAERFSELYDNEWTEAFETMIKSRIFTEREGIDILRNIVERAYTFCKHESSIADNGEEQKQIERLQLKFCDQLHGPESKSVECYAKRCVELCWWMWTHSPPVYMVPASKDGFDPNLYRAYTKSGSIPDFFVWPALKLYEEGGVLSKGIVQYK